MHVMNAKKTDIFHDTTVSVSFLDWDKIDSLKIKHTSLSIPFLLKVLFSFFAFCLLKFDKVLLFYQRFVLLSLIVNLNCFICLFLSCLVTRTRSTSGETRMLTRMTLTVGPCLAIITSRTL